MRDVPISPYQWNMVWKKGLNEAACHKFKMRQHLAPDKNCECGIYAYHSLYDGIDERNNVMNNDVSIAVTVALRAGGKVCVHLDRWRSQNVEVIAVLNRGRGAELASQYFNVPLLDQRHFERYAQEHGEIKGKWGLPVDFPALPEKEINELVALGDQLLSELEFAYLCGEAALPETWQEYIERIGYKGQLNISNASAQEVVYFYTEKLLGTNYSGAVSRRIKMLVEAHGIAHTALITRRKVGFVERVSKNGNNFEGWVGWIWNLMVMGSVLVRLTK